MPAERTRQSFYLLPPERLLPASTLTTWLGRIVKSYSEPDANFVPVDPEPFITHPFATSTITNASLAALSQQHKSLAARLGASGIHASRETSDGGGLSFTSSEILCVRLQDHDGVFERLRQHTLIRGQLEKMLARGGNVGFMVTAALIWRDAVFTHSRKRGVETSTSIAVPISTFISSIMLPPNATDPSLSGSHGRQGTGELSGESAGSHIFALQYKTVRRSVIQSFLGMHNGIALKEEGPDLPAAHSFAVRDPGDSGTQLGDEDERSSNDGSDGGDGSGGDDDDDDGGGGD